MKKRMISLALIAALLLAVLPMAAAAQGSDFEDVSDSDYFASAVRWAVSWGVTNGTSETTFSPELICTRGQVVTFLWRAHGEPEPKTAYNPFADVPRGSYFDRATLWAVEQGITTGTSENPKLFSPDQPCTKAEILTFIWRAKGSQKPEFPSPLTSEWPDDLYYKDAVTWADNNAMLEDEGEVFDPVRLCTRGHTMAWLYREAQVYASDPESLLKAIGSGHELHLSPGVYNLTEWIDTMAEALVEPESDLELAAALGEGVELSPFVKLERVLDGYEVVIHDVRNLSIVAGPSFTPGTVEIVVEPRYATVLTFENCDKVFLSDLIVGHTPEQGYCTGGVLCFRDCGRVALSGMDLYGCGTYGIEGERVDSIQTVDSVIRECSYGLLVLRQVRDAGFGGVRFHDCTGFDMLNLRESSASFQACEFINNTWDESWSHFLAMDALADVTFRSCTFDRATHFDLTDERLAGSRIVIENPTIVD